MALGATTRDVAVLVLREGLVTALVGAGLGLVLAWGATRSIGALLYGIQWHDVGVFVIVPSILIAVALVATYLPARRAARISAVIALRHE